MAKRTSPKTEAKASPPLDYKAYCTYHPGAVLLGGFQYEERIVEDLKRYHSRQLKYPRSAAPSGRAHSIGFDTEYDPSGKLLTAGVADASNAIAYEGNIKKSIAPTIKKAKVLIGHSIAGDLDHLVRLGLARDSWLRGLDIRDSFLLARMHDENRGKGAYGLEALLLSEFNATPWKADTDKLIKATGNAADWSPEQRMERCRLDAWATRVLAEHLEGKLHGFDSADPD
jgi:hypothetical protein